MLPASFFLMGLIVGGGLLYSSFRAYHAVQELDRIPWCQAGDAVNGMVRLMGRATATEALLTSPLSQRQCMYYRFTVEGPGGDASAWAPVVDEVQSMPITVVDRSGEVWLPRLKEADVELVSRKQQPGISVSPLLLQTLAERYQLETRTAVPPQDLRFREVVLTPGADVYLVGECVVQGGKATFTSRLQLRDASEGLNARARRSQMFFFAFAGTAIMLGLFAIAAFLQVQISSHPLH